MADREIAQDVVTSRAPSAFLQPPPHCLVRGFLGDAMVERLLDHAVSNETNFTPTKIGTSTARSSHVDPTMRLSRELRDLRAIRRDLAPRLKSVVPATIAKLGTAPFELANLEIHLVAHRDGDFFARHIDTTVAHPDLSTDRVISGVYYFSAVPRAFTGGTLRLHSIAPTEAGGTFVEIQPDRDMLVLFPSWVPHEVLPVACPSGRFIDSRFSINCWFRRARASPSPAASSLGGVAGPT